MSWGKGCVGSSRSVRGAWEGRLFQAWLWLWLCSVRVWIACCWTSVTSGAHLLVLGGRQGRGTLCWFGSVWWLTCRRVQGDTVLGSASPATAIFVLALFWPGLAARRGTWCLSCEMYVMLVRLNQMTTLGRSEGIRLSRANITSTSSQSLLLVAASCVCLLTKLCSLSFQCTYELVSGPPDLLSQRVCTRSCDCCVFELAGLQERSSSGAGA